MEKVLLIKNINKKFIILKLNNLNKLKKKNKLIIKKNLFGNNNKKLRFLKNKENIIYNKNYKILIIIQINLIRKKI